MSRVTDYVYVLNGNITQKWFNHAYEMPTQR
jgi:hypothetical protein